MKKENKKGFLLLEMIIYVAIFSIFVTGLFLFVNSIIEFRTSSRTVIEVNSQGSRIVSVVTQSVRNASSLELVDASTLIVDNNVFYKEKEVIYLNEEKLSNSRVVVDEASFYLYGNETVRILLNLSSSCNGFSNQFYGSATLRKPENE